MEMAADSGNTFLKEWEESRSVLKTFDDRLHDIRKYGFSFITAFLTATTILFERYIVDPSTGFTGEVFPESIKATILGVTLLLILGLYILDRNYRVFQKAASTRINVLEKLLNIELSDVITQRYRKSLVEAFMTVVYLCFVAGVGLLGLAVLSNSLIYLLTATLIVGLVILILSIDFFVVKFRYGMIDWILDKLECKQGDEVRIILTNLSGKDFPKEALAEEVVMWKFVKQCDNPNKMDNNDKKILRTGVLCKGFQIDPSHNYIWILETKEQGDDKYLDPGIYCIYRRVFTKKGEMLPENKMHPLCRKLRIISKPKDSPPKPTIHRVIMESEPKSK